MEGLITFWFDLVPEHRPLGISVESLGAAVEGDLEMEGCRQEGTGSCTQAEGLVSSRSMNRSPIAVGERKDRYMTTDTGRLIIILKFLDT